MNHDDPVCYIIKYPSHSLSNPPKLTISHRRVSPAVRFQAATIARYAEPDTTFPFAGCS